MQLCLRPFYIILRQQNNFEWTHWNAKNVYELNVFLTEPTSNTIPYPDQPFYSICDASKFGMGAALLQSQKNLSKMNLISASSRLFTQAGFGLSTLMRECPWIEKPYSFVSRS